MPFRPTDIGPQINQAYPDTLLGDKTAEFGEYDQSAWLAHGQHPPEANTIITKRGRRLRDPLRCSMVVFDKIFDLNPGLCTGDMWGNAVDLKSCKDPSSLRRIQEKA